MSTLHPTVEHGDSAGHEGHADHGHGHHQQSFLSKYVFSTDHKMIGMQFLCTTLIMLMVGGALALGVRWQLARPWEYMPILGDLVFKTDGGQISPETYTMLFTMHATVMIFLVIIPILAGAFGNFLIPLQIGADDMAFPVLNMLSYWFMWPAIFFLGASFFFGGGPASGWTSYPLLSAMPQAAPGSGHAQTFWLAGVTFVGVSSMMGSINYMTTIINMRAPGMTLFRMPLTIWSMFITAILQAFALPVLTAAGAMMLTDRLLGTCFFIPAGIVDNNAAPTIGGGQPLLWQHLFWFYSHPAVYIMLLPAMGMVSDMLACMCRKPVFGYKPMIYSMASIAGLGFIVWGHHMFISGMNPALGMTFMVSTMMIALPSAVKTFNWIGTIWGGRIQFNTVLLNCVAFVSMFIIGGLSGIFMAAVPVDIYIHDTYFIVAHIHYVLFASSLFGIFAGIYYWFPKMFGKMMNDNLGKAHFVLTFILGNCTFFPMHMAGVAGLRRRIPDITASVLEGRLLDLNVFMSISALLLGSAQLIFLFNFVWSLFFGQKAGKNPWHSNTLEWAAGTEEHPVPGHGNFDVTPVVHCWPYEYGDFTDTKDNRLQTEKSDMPTTATH